MGDVMSSVLDCDVGGACKTPKWGCWWAVGYTSPKHKERSERQTGVRVSC